MNDYNKPHLILFFEKNEGRKVLTLSFQHSL